MLRRFLFVVCCVLCVSRVPLFVGCSCFGCGSLLFVLACCLLLVVRSLLCVCCCVLGFVCCCVVVFVVGLSLLCVVYCRFVVVC